MWMTVKLVVYGIKRHINRPNACSTPQPAKAGIAVLKFLWFKNLFKQIILEAIGSNIRILLIPSYLISISDSGSISSLN